jgi:carbamoyltransferase
MKNNYVGFTQGFHTESLAIIDENGLYDFYPKGFDPSIVKTDNIAFYERPFLKRTRQFYAGQYKTTFKPLKLKLKPKYFFPHHLCHAANAFQQSPYYSANIVVADSIGEWDTVTTWKASYDAYGFAKYKKVTNRSYPFSIGLFYSSITQLIGLKPNAEENKLIEFADKGTYNPILDSMLFDQLLCRNNHRGCLGMYPYYSKEDIAYNAQRVLENYLESYFKLSIPNCFSGGVAFNKTFIDRMRKKGYIIYVPENPGDAGSAIGAAALLYRKKIKSR